MIIFSGRPYLFQVRAFNRVGPGPWSESLEVVSGAGAPDTPNAPRVQCRGPSVALLDWNEPSFNGAMVTEYRLQLAIVSSRKCLSPPPTLTTPSSTVSSSTSSSVIEDEVCIYKLLSDKPVTLNMLLRMILVVQRY